MRNLYIHIGNNRVLKTKKIVGVFDMDTSTVSKISREFLENEEKNGRLISEFDDLPRSFVIVSESKGSKTYISSLNAAAINRRSKKKKIF